MKTPSSLLHEMRSWPATEREMVRRDLLTRFPAWPDGTKEWPERMPCNVRPYVLFVGISSGGSPPRGSIQPENDIPKPSPGHLTFGVRHPNFDCADGTGFFSKLRDLAQALVEQADPAFSQQSPENDHLTVSGLLNLGLGFDGTANASSTNLGIIEWVSDVTEKLSSPVIVGSGLKAVFANEDNQRAWARGGSQFAWGPPWAGEIPIVGGFKLRWKCVRYGNGEVGRVFLLPNHPSRYPLRSARGWSDTKRAMLQVLGEAPVVQ